jgi:hypothetical protein
VVGPVETAEQELVPGVVLEETEVKPEEEREEREAERLKEELELDLDQEEPEALQEPEQPSQGW